VRDGGEVAEGWGWRWVWGGGREGQQWGGRHDLAAAGGCAGWSTRVGQAAGMAQRAATLRSRNDQDVVAAPPFPSQRPAWNPCTSARQGGG
jgi:hypothetical protein